MATTREVTVGLIQMRPGKDADDSLRTALLRIEEAAGMGAQIVALPELFQSPYFCQRKHDPSAFDLAETIPGKTTEALAAAAEEHGIVLVAGSIYEEAKGKYYNTTPVFGPDGGLIGTYRKTHIPEDILYHEQHYFEPGDTGVRVFDTPFGKVAPLICYDQWFPEAARIACLRGAEILFYPTAIGVVDGSVEENITGDWEQMWRNAMLGHAASNNVFVAAINRTGREDAIHFWGGSFVADPSSALITKAGAEETIVLARCDLGRVKPLRDSWRFLHNRRTDAYGPLSDKHDWSMDQFGGAGKVPKR